MPTQQEQLDELTKGIAAAKGVKDNHEALEKLVRENIVPTMVALQKDIQVSANNRYEEGAAQIERDFVVTNRENGATPAALKGILDGKTAFTQVEQHVRLISADSIDEELGLITERARNDWQAEVQRTWDRVVFVGCLYGKRSSKDRLTKGLRSRLLRLLKSGPPAIAKAFSDVATLGAEFIPDVMSAAYFTDVRNEAIIAPLFKQLTMTDKNLQIPWIGFGATPYLKGVIADNNPAQFPASEPATAQRTMTAKGIAIRTVIDEDANEDSIVSFVDLLMSEHARALADARDDMIINGQASGSIDTLTAYNPSSRWSTARLGQSIDHRKAVDGLRRRAISTLALTDNSGTVTAPLMLTLRGKLGGGHAGRIDEHVILASVKGLIKLMGTAQVETVEKIGPDATILKGNLLKIYGVPIKVTDFLSDTYEATGYYTNGSGAKGQILYANAGRFILGTRKVGAVETARDITRGSLDVVSTWRGDFITQDANTGEGSKNVSAAINLTV